MKPSITSNTPIWGIHAGRTGDADYLFLSKNCVALGWHSMGDLSKLAPIFQHYEKFDSRFKSVLPLRRIYVPELIEDAGE